MQRLVKMVPDEMTYLGLGIEDNCYIVQFLDWDSPIELLLHCLCKGTALCQYSYSKKLNNSIGS